MDRAVFIHNTLRDFVSHFALRGITPEFCVQEAMHGMMHRRTIIVPSAFMRACTTAQKLLPASLLMPIVARQQKKKLG